MYSALDEVRDNLKTLRQLTGMNFQIDVIEPLSPWSKTKTYRIVKVDGEEKTPLFSGYPSPTLLLRSLLDMIQLQALITSGKVKI